MFNDVYEVLYVHTSTHKYILEYRCARGKGERGDCKKGVLTGPPCGVGRLNCEQKASFWSVRLRCIMDLLQEAFGNHGV